MLKSSTVLVTMVISILVGFGHDLAVELDSQGCTVYAGCLLPDGDGAKQLRELNSSRMHVLHLDVTNDSHATDAVQCVERQNKGKKRKAKIIILSRIFKQ